MSNQSIEDRTNEGEYAAGPETRRITNQSQEKLQEELVN